MVNEMFFRLFGNDLLCTLTHINYKIYQIKNKN